MFEDTSPAQVERYFSLLRGASPQRRLQAAAALTAGVRALALAGLRHRFPEASEEELRGRMAVLLYGRAVASRWYASLPADAR